jgi:hypothetical protein
MGRDWRATIKLGELFKITVALTDININPSHFENCSFRGRVFAKVNDMRNNSGTPWTPDDLEPEVRQCLLRRGFTTIEHLKELRNTNSDNCLARALVVYFLCCRQDAKTKKPSSIPRCKRSGVSRTKSNVTPSQLEKNQKDEMEAVLDLHIEAERRRRTQQPTEKPLLNKKHEEEAAGDSETVSDQEAEEEEDDGVALAISDENSSSEQAARMDGSLTQWAIQLDSKMSNWMTKLECKVLTSMMKVDSKMSAACIRVFKGVE